MTKSHFSLLGWLIPLCLSGVYGFGNSFPRAFSTYGTKPNIVKAFQTLLGAWNLEFLFHFSSCDITLTIIHKGNTIANHFTTSLDELKAAKWCHYSLTFCFSLQVVAAGRLGVCWLPEHQGGVVVRLGDFRGPWSLWDTFKRVKQKILDGHTDIQTIAAFSEAFQWPGDKTWQIFLCFF